MEKKRYYKLTYEGKSVIFDSLDNIDVYIPFAIDCIVGDKWEIGIIELTENEYKELPEFEGF
jgi:hypothetical protein